MKKLTSDAIATSARMQRRSKYAGEIAALLASGNYSRAAAEVELSENPAATLALALLITLERYGLHAMDRVTKGLASYA